MRMPAGKSACCFAISAFHLLLGVSAGLPRQSEPTTRTPSGAKRGVHDAGTPLSLTMATSPTRTLPAPNVLEVGECLLRASVSLHGVGDRERSDAQRVKASRVDVDDAMAGSRPAASSRPSRRLGAAPARARRDRRGPRGAP